MRVDLRARLLNQTAAAGRIDWDARPQTGALPAVTLELVSDPRDQHMGGNQATRQPRVRAHCWAATAKAAHELAEDVAATLEPSAVQGDTRFLRSFVTIYGEVPTDAETGQIHHVVADIDLTHTPIP